jgi:hypothetical protein
MSGESLKQILVDTLRGTKEEKNYRVWGNIVFEVSSIYMMDLFD